MKIKQWKHYYGVFIFLTLTWFSFDSYAQHDPQFSQNMFNHLSINPAYAGARADINASLLNRTQWKGFPGAPVTTTFNIDARLNLAGKKDGIGLSIINDALGMDKFVTLSLMYTWRKELWDGELGAGLSGGMISKKTGKFSDLPGNDLIDSDDKYITDGENKGIAGDFSIGVFYNHKRYYMGISAKHINVPSIKISDNSEYSIQNHYYFTGGYNIIANNPLFEIKPSLFFKTDIASFQLDMNVNVHYDKKYWGGLSYRINDAIVVMGGMEFKSGIVFGYAYDITTSAIARYSSGSHELYMAYSFGLGKKRNKKYKSVRYL